MKRSILIINFTMLLTAFLLSGCAQPSDKPIKDAKQPNADETKTSHDIETCGWIADPDITKSEEDDLSDDSGQSPKDEDVVLRAYLELLESHTTSEEVKLCFHLKNVSETPLYILKWYTPLEGIGGEIFRVTYNGETIPYEGILAYRTSPGDESYILLNPGESASAVVDLASSFDLSTPGVYQIEFISPRISHIAHTAGEMAKSLDELGPVQIPSNTLRFELGAD